MIVAGSLAFSLFFVIFLFAPYSGKEAAMFWGMRLAFGSFAVVFALWLKARLKELPPEKNVEPLRNDSCLLCNGGMPKNDVNRIGNFPSLLRLALVRRTFHFAGRATLVIRSVARCRPHPGTCSI